MSHWLLTVALLDGEAVEQWYRDSVVSLQATFELSHLLLTLLVRFGAKITPGAVAHELPACAISRTIWLARSPTQSANLEAGQLLESQAMRQGTGFTLVELVVVILLLSVLAAVATPRLLSASQKADHAALLTNLDAIRQAVDEFKLINGHFPGKDGLEATFKSDLKTVLRGEFPVCSVGAKNAQVRISTTTGGLGITGEATPSKGWHYHNKKGLFIINSTATSSEGVAYDKY
jgi:prepilin-type N-terminal cleavage/methylation domain-containing protein